MHKQYWMLFVSECVIMLKNIIYHQKEYGILIKQWFTKFSCCDVLIYNVIYLIKYCYVLDSDDRIWFQKMVILIKEVIINYKKMLKVLKVLKVKKLVTLNITYCGVNAAGEFAYMYGIKRKRC